MYGSRKRHEVPAPVSSEEKRVSIEKLVHGGLGLARTADGVVLVRGVLAGETVSAVQTGMQGGIPVLEPAAFLTCSSSRREPACPVFGTCGGCDWLYIDYKQQVAYKKLIFDETMRRVGRIDTCPEPEIIADKEFGYRRRAQIKIGRNGECGFFKRGSNDVVVISRCPLLTDRLNALLESLPGDPAVKNGTISNLRCVDGDALLATDPHIEGVSSLQTSIRYGEMELIVGGGSFVQSNRFLLEPLAELVAGFSHGETFVDLYGGTGFFSLYIASRFAKGWLIENDKEMVAEAAENFTAHKITTVHAIAASAEKMEHYVPKNPDVLIVDPPRPGLTRKAREAVKRLRPRKIIYVSCNCATQARDAGYFLKDETYRITASALIDLYPNTHHTETLLVFEAV